MFQLEPARLRKVNERERERKLLGKKKIKNLTFSKTKSVMHIPLLALALCVVVGSEVVKDLRTTIMDKQFFSQLLFRSWSLMR